MEAEAVMMLVTSDTSITSATHASPASAPSNAAPLNPTCHKFLMLMDASFFAL
jgi:hypothetical protein